MKWYITGDCHGDISRFKNFSAVSTAEKIGIIILGDAGINYYLNKKDNKIKQELENTDLIYYLVRGNHEERPENLPDIVTIIDEQVKNEVFIEPQYPHIRYLKDGYTYNINNHSTLVLGGAYSVDKEWRISCGYGWFPAEQLSEKEKNNIYNNIKGKNFDIILSHSCPISFEPVDLFLHISQNGIDKSMEIWLDKVKDNCNWKVWCFGHYHADRLERPRVEMFFQDICELEEVWERWETSKVDWWLDKSPNYYMT